MQASLVKIDVAAADLGKSVAMIFDLVEGSYLLEPGLVWVFNLANNAAGARRDLRFWRPELTARAQGAGQSPTAYGRYEIDWVIARILPEKRSQFHAGEVDQLFQIRPRTRIDFGAELNGELKEGRNFYARPVLAQFLKRRWLGAISARLAQARAVQASVTPNQS